MARTVTLTQLQTDIAVQADVVLGSSGRYSTTQVTRFINQSIQRFRERVSDLGINRYLVSTSDYMNAGPSGSYPFGLIDLTAASPAVVRVFGVDVEYQTVVRTLKQISFAERDQFNGPNLNSVPAAWSQYRDNKIALFPPPDQAYFYTVWYLPLLTDLSSGSDTFDGVAGWEEFIIWDVVCRLLNKDQYAAAYGMAAAERESRWQDVLRGATRVSHAGPTTVGRDVLLDRPACAIPESDMFNSPTSAQEGEVALASSNGRINWYAGVEAGDRLEWTGSIWIKKRGWVTPDIDLTGATDATAAIQSALTAARHGQVVYLPDGVIRLNSGLSIPAFITLAGSPRGHRIGPYQFYDGTNSGTQLRAYGTGDLLTCFSAGGPHGCQAIRDLEIYYPDQQVNAAPDVYGWTIKVGLNAHWVTVENITAINPYKFLGTGTDGAANGITIDDVHAFPLNTGMTFGRVADVARIRNVHFGNCDYRIGSTLLTYVQQNAVAFNIDGPEEINFTDCFAYGYLRGLRFHDLDGDAFRGVYGSFRGGGFDVCEICIRLDDSCMLTARGFKISDCSLVPATATHAGFGILTADDLTPSQMDHSPVLMLSNVSFSGSTYDSPIYTGATSHAVIVATNCTMQQFTNQGVYINGANSKVYMNQVAMATGATRSVNGGGGTLSDVNQITI